MDKEINYCKSFADKIAGKIGIKVKLRYLLDDFFFNEGWAARTNPKVHKEGYTAQLTYNEETIKHFIEDCVRHFAREFELEVNTVIEGLAQKEA